MKRSVIGWIAAGVLAVGGAAFAWVFWFAGGSGEPSTELTTPDLLVTTTEPGDSSGDGADTTIDSEGASTAYVIDQSQSTASFQIDEVLRGEPKTVVGVTDQVAGQVAVEPNDLGASQFSDIVINARTFQTDSDQRNRAIRGPVILNSASDEFEFITFSPTSVDGLDGETAQVGSSYQFSVSGDLTIRGTTAPVDFDVTVEMVDDATLVGSATATVLRSDFGIGIPNVPSVADVSDEVILSLEFTAVSG